MFDMGELVERLIQFYQNLELFSRKKLNNGGSHPGGTNTIFFRHHRSATKLTDRKKVRSAGYVRLKYPFVSVNGMSGDILKYQLSLKYHIAFLYSDFQKYKQTLTMATISVAFLSISCFPVVS